MTNSKRDKISYLGEFVDKELEKEFLIYDMKRYAKVLGPIALVFGIMYMLFFISDYLAIQDSFKLAMIFAVRVLFLLSSTYVFFVAKKIKGYYCLPYLMTAYKALAIAGFFIIVYLYETLTMYLFFSVVVINLAIYITPNRLRYAQAVSAFLILTFFVCFAGNIEGIGSRGLINIIGYSIIILIYCNIGAYLTNYFKRKQFLIERELVRVSITDSLTGVYNRAKFNEELEHWISFSNRYKRDLALVMFDIDDFKKINDSYGHYAGDAVIKNVTEAVKKTIRSTDVFARWGGDEFIILLPNTDTDQAKEMMERVRINIQSTNSDKVGNITCSFGLVALEENEGVDPFLHRADKLLYKAKACGKNMVSF